jgi:quercetin dioxygenase-like cupin family protein
MRKERLAFFPDPSTAPKILQMVGLETTILTGLSREKMMMALNTTLPGHTVPLQSHPPEQIGVVHGGKARLRIGDQQKIV